MQPWKTNGYGLKRKRKDGGKKEKIERDRKKSR